MKQIRKLFMKTQSLFGFSHTLIFLSNIILPSRFYQNISFWKSGKVVFHQQAERSKVCDSLSSKSLPCVEIWNMHCCHQPLSLLHAMTQTCVNTFKIMRLHNRCDLATSLVNKTPETPELEPWTCLICHSLLVPLEDA